VEDVTTDWRAGSVEARRSLRDGRSRCPPRLTAGVDQGDRPAVGLGKPSPAARSKRRLRPASQSQAAGGASSASPRRVEQEPGPARREPGPTPPRRIRVKLRSVVPPEHPANVLHDIVTTMPAEPGGSRSTLRTGPGRPGPGTEARRNSGCCPRPPPDLAGVETCWTT